MTAAESTELAALIQEVKDMRKQLDKNTQDTQAIRSTLDNLTGGKQALMWVTGLSIAIAGTIIGWLHTRK